MSRRLTRTQKTYRDIGKMMKTTGKIVHTLSTGKRKKTKSKKVLGLFNFWKIK